VCHYTLAKCKTLAKLKTNQEEKPPLARACSSCQ